MLRYSGYRIAQKIVIRHVAAQSTSIRPNSQLPPVPEASVAQHSRRHGVRTPFGRQQIRPFERNILIQKHEEAVQQMDSSNLFNLTDSFEFVDEVSEKALSVALGLIRREPETLKELNDHRLAVLISVAGGKTASTVAEKTRKQYLDTMWSSIEQHPNAGIEAANAYIRTSIGMSLQMDVIKALDILQKLKLSPNQETYEVLVTKLGLEGNVEGVVEIIREMKAERLPLSQIVVEAWIRALAFRGAHKEAQAVLAAFKSSLDIFRLHFAMASGYIQADKFEECERSLVELPAAESKPTAENVDVVIDFLFQLLDQRPTKAVDIVKKYMPMGRLSFPTQKRLRLKGVQLVKSGNILAALQIPLLTQEDKPVCAGLLDSFYDILVSDLTDSRRTDDENASVNRIVEFTNAVHELGLATYPLADFIHHALNRDMNVNKFYNIFAHSAEIDRLFANQETEGSRRHVVIPLVAEISNRVGKSKVGDSAYRDLIRLCAFIDEFHRHSTDSLVRVLIKKDAAYLTSLFSQVTNSTSLASSIFAAMISAGQLDRLEQLMKHTTNGEIKLFASRVVTPLIKLLKTPKLDDSDLSTIVKIIAAGFTTSSKGAETSGGRAIALILGSPTIPDDRVEKLVKILVDEPKVTISSAEVRSIDAKLRELNLPQRAELVKYLKRKSTAYQRWQATENIADLEEEAASLAKIVDIQPSILCTLYEVILRKAADSKNADAIMRTLPKFFAIEKTAHDVKVDWAQINRSYYIAFKKFLEDSQWDSVDKLWQLRPSKVPELAILYAMVLCKQQKQEEAQSVLKYLKSSAVTLQLSDFCNSGNSKIRNLISEDAMDSFLEICSKQFNMTPKWKSTLKADAKLGKLKALLAEQKRAEAYNLSLETSKDVGYAFGAYELMSAALQAEDKTIVAQVNQHIKSAEDQNTCLIVLGVCLLELGDKRGEVCLKKINHIPSGKLVQLTKRLVEQKNPALMHYLFNLFNKPGTTMVELEGLMEKTADLYERQGDVHGLKKLRDDAQASSMPLSAKTRAQFKNAIDKLEAQRLETSSNESKSTDSSV